MTPFGSLIKLNAFDGRSCTPSLNHLISGEGKPTIWASRLSGCPMVTLMSLMGLTKAGLIGSAVGVKRIVN